MDKNIEIIRNVTDYIELHLEEELKLDIIAKEMGYSKYHLHRMFTAVIGFPVHQYIQRRRLTEAARMLITSNKSIMELSLFAGYDTQQSFTRAFRAMYKCSPQVFRKQGEFCPLQLRYNVSETNQVQGDKTLEVKIVESGQIVLIGYCKNTKRGFHAIGRCWHMLHKYKHKILNRTDPNFLIGVNDYTNQWNCGSDYPVFDYYAAAQVDVVSEIPKGMHMRELPPSKYVVFCFRGKNEDSMQPVADYIYKTWFPQSTCRFNENSMYDFIEYGDQVDSSGVSDIEYWVPIE